MREARAGREGGKLKAAIELPTDFASRLAREVVDERSAIVRKELGQFFTPPSVARFMGRLASNAKQPRRILDPGAGTGILSAAVCEALPPGAGPVHVDAFESDPLAADLCEQVLAHTTKWCETECDVRVTFEVFRADFIARHAERLRPSLYTEDGGVGYDLAILNPPYFKLQKNDPRAVAAGALVHGQPNIYSLFMGIAAALLSEDGVLVSITPRSFAHGDYFRLFRQHLFGLTAPEAVHLFRSRKDAFRRDEVLQENAILLLRRTTPSPGASVRISESAGISDIGDVEPRSVPLQDVVDLQSADLTFRIPTSPADDVIVEFLREQWRNTLKSMRVSVSTGPVVAFRSLKGLMEEPGPGVVPLLWLNNVRALGVEWPGSVNTKPQYILDAPPYGKLLVSNDANYVLLRRFTAKEERRRLTAAPLRARELPGEVIGLENHLNYIYRAGDGLTQEEANGLAALFNSALLDRYVRISNGNTQVNASELRNLPLPPHDTVVALGRAILHERPTIESLEVLLARYLELPAQVVEALRDRQLVGRTA